MISDELRTALRDARILAERAGYDDTADALESIELELDAAASQEESHATENGNPRPSGRGGCQ